VERFRLVRVLRTLSSEIYLVWRDEQRIGQIDIHYTASSVQADVCLESPLDEPERDALLRQLDEDVVSSHLPSFEREQFIITIFVGREIDSFNYPPDSDEIGEN
jgi:hypothetical protein